ncbi:MAG: polysaccharide biosynthesis/export family protein [Victivallales bacterium]|nr:hypothetical protein [Lentisphaeria bacterium]HCG50838.1 hypothetical protein [Lentisphaeria bacterium]
MKKIILFAFSAFLALLAGCTADSFAPVAIPNHYSVKPPEPVNERDLTEQLKKLHTPDTSPYKITPGDQFDITVYEHPELTVRQIIVTPDGFVSAPLIGPVKIGGLSLVEATEALKKQISQYIRKPLVSLIPIRINGYNFTIVGRVNVPGCYPISIGNTRLIDAVAMARGLSEGLFHGDTVELADLENAYISRDGRLLPVNFQKALLRGDPLHNIPLKNGDYIYIPSVMNSTVALLGQVGKPTYVGFKEGMTVLQALPYGGGLRETHSDEIKVIRGGLKNPVVYTVNVTKMQEGKIMDFPLQANDIVYVPADGISDWNVIVRKILPSLQGLSMLAGPFGNPSAYWSND